MSEHELEKILNYKVDILNLKKKAFESLETLFVENSQEKDFLCGYEKDEIKTVFDRFEFHLSHNGYKIIRTRIGLYIEDSKHIWIDNLEPIGYYALDTEFDGEISDDWFKIEKEKR